MPAGTRTLADLRAERFQSVADFGLDTINEILTNDFAAYNAITTQAFAELCDVTQDNQRIYGTSASTAILEEGDDFDPGVARKPPATGVTCGFPLRRYPVNLGWNETYFITATPADLAEAVIAIQQSYTRTMLRDLKRSIFYSTNETFYDRHAVPRINLTVRRLLNADSTDIPNGPNGETFTAASHTHYDYIDSATPTHAGMLAAQNDVMEHGHVEGVRQYINIAAESAVRAFGDFVPYVDPRLVMRSSDTPSQTLDITRMDNRAIGLHGAAEVWVKPWVPAGYVFTFAANDMRKPLVMRQHTAQALRGMRVASRISSFPLYADQMESYWGFGVWTRTNGHVLYYAGGANAYVAPTITS